MFTSFKELEAYVLGCGEGNARKRTTFCSSAEPTYLDRYEVYVDERNTAQEEDVTDAEYLERLCAILPF